METSTMKAARLEEGSLEIRDLPTPEPGFEEARIRIRSAGVCHSDLHIVRGDWLGVPRSGVVGHEAIGVVEALGPGADRYAEVGDRVILGLGGSGGGYWCGACEYCLRGEPRHCSQTQGIMGTFAEQFCVWAKSLVKLPDSVGDEEAPLACGGLTAYGALKKLVKHQIQPGRAIAIVGAAGGLGHYAVQIAKAFGYKVIGVDIGSERLAFVESLGADMAVDANDAIEAVERELGGVDASIVFSARMAGFDLGLKLLRRGGLFVAVGLPATSEGNLQLNPFEFFLRDPTLIYSAVGNVQDMRELVDMAAAGQVKSHIGRVGALSELGAIFDELEAGKYVGRAVITDLGR
jgi:propanol-preferring alcohol dehydrogenase